MVKVYDVRAKKIEVCGKEFYFNNLPVKELEELTKPAEELSKEIAEKQIEAQNILMKIKEKGADAADLLSQRERLLKLYDKVVGSNKLNENGVNSAKLLLEDAANLKKKADKIIKSMEKEQKTFGEKNEELVKHVEEITPKLNAEHAKVCCEVLENFTIEDFEKRSSNDEPILKNIIEFKDKILANVPENKLKLRYKEIVESKYDTKPFQEE